MSAISFFSSNTYLYIPNTKTPRVALPIGTKKQAKNAFKLYQPFSLKAKVYKQIMLFLCVYLNPISRCLTNTKKHKESIFIKYLKTTLNTSITTSIYFATSKDKVVLQLQTNNIVFGYLKFPLNKIGSKHINNEINAFKVLEKQKISASKTIKISIYKSNPYIILPELKGKITLIEEVYLEEILKKFKKKKQSKLEYHKRIIALKLKLETLNLLEYTIQLNAIIKKSSLLYFEVFEHGDFTPWNIIKTNNGYVPFDFEFFTENGLEHLDLIKYHFQVGRLLKHKNETQIIGYIYNKVKTPEVNLLLAVFLIKEIICLKTQDLKDTFFNKTLQQIEY